MAKLRPGLWAQVAMADDKHDPNAASVLLDIYRLLSIFMASERFATLADKDGVQKVFANIERDEITRILLSVAATIRLVEDRTFKEKAFDWFVGPRGELVEDVQKPSTSKNLDIREACNKILHSQHIASERRPLSTGRGALEP